MKVQAQQGDTVDLLCYRHYRRTQGVVTQVLDANPGLCLATVLRPGQWVEMPDITEPKQKDTVQLWD
ncbi:TPA: tail protein X [Morganella morganii]|uniref:Phage tail protein n=1 Tax=Morganella morganii TaxID=582 RepID=A0A2S1BAK4_MORMO|nr:tail protein X [Morganella morganii]HAS8351672.1 phage tail protein [Vibrio vulnificus]AUR30008.1 phage tail protein [Morganella morganii]AWC93123.1 phage tail protein [Morganella morganii]EKT0593979.1 tail protein X [Morganella morganii]EKT0594000.1 tail protein X [Morganella morganii]